MMGFFKRTKVKAPEPAESAPASPAPAAKPDSDAAPMDKMKSGWKNMTDAQKKDFATMADELDQEMARHPPHPPTARIIGCSLTGVWAAQAGAQDLLQKIQEAYVDEAVTVTGTRLALQLYY
jgi:hypothetical protein